MVEAQEVVVKESQTGAVTRLFPYRVTGLLMGRTKLQEFQTRALDLVISTHHRMERATKLIALHQAILPVINHISSNISYI